MIRHRGTEIHLLYNVMALFNQQLFLAAPLSVYRKRSLTCRNYCNEGNWRLLTLSYYRSFLDSRGKRYNKRIDIYNNYRPCRSVFNERSKNAPQSRHMLAINCHYWQQSHDKSHSKNKETHCSGLLGGIVSDDWCVFIHLMIHKSLSIVLARNSDCYESNIVHVYDSFIFLSG